MTHARACRALLLLLAVGVAGCAPSGGQSVSPEPTAAFSASASSSGAVPAGGEAVVLAAGDVAACDSVGDESTAALLDGLDGTILALGDLAYPSGRVYDFAKCYDTSWGRHRDRTYAVPGNHEYETAGAIPYFTYFGAAAGARDESWYVFTLGDWRLIGLNSNCDEVGGCGPDSPQAQWLGDLLAEPHQPACTLAFWHHPRWSSGDEHGSDPRTDTFWRLLSEAGADLVLTGHEHQYERFGPMDADGAADPDGMVEFIVGTGGRSLYEFADILPTSAAHDGARYGVLKLTLRPSAYKWEWVPTSYSGFTDVGAGDCR
jgi:hypothetical protein